MSTTNPTEFWRKIQQIGPRRDRNIPIEVLDEDGSISTAENTVFERWKHDFYNLYNCKEESDFDEVHNDCAKVHKLLLENNMNDPLYELNVQLNLNVTIDEVTCVIQKSKSGSACGYDELPYEVLKSPVIIACLQQLFQYVFDSCVIPSVWRRAIVCLILKDPSSDRRDPMNYRGISLLSCINKLYTSLLNTRLTGYLETNDMLADEQNGFRKQRSCEDHMFTLNSLIKNNSNVFTAFIDLKRCFDYVDRDMLLYKLLLHHIDGKFYNSIKSIYTSTVSAIRINNKLTDWFDCTTGVRQGCNLSPTLYSVFANDLVKEINDLDIGIQVGERKISLLAYADDICLVANSEDNLQQMLNCVHSWCKRWRVLINANKSKCMHFRRGRSNRSEYTFKIGENVLETTDRYKYLGVIFHEKQDYSINSEALGKAAGRALGSIISKIHSLKEFGFKAYEKLYSSCVMPILDYCSAVWGFKNYQQIDNVQNRAMRYFLGVHRFTPILAMLGDTGWLPSVYRRWISMLRLWNRLILMDDDRLTKCAFNADYEINQNNWCQDVKHVMSCLGLSNHYENKTVINLSNANDRMHAYYSNIWSRDIRQIPKLRTYIIFKQSFKTENYVQLNLCKNERSILCQFRTGILPLRLETGRYIGEKVEHRLCKLCTAGAVENEIHFLLHCDLYTQIRENTFSDIFRNNTELPDVERLCNIVNSQPRKLAKYLVCAYLLRKRKLFS